MGCDPAPDLLTLTLGKLYGTRTLSNDAVPDVLDEHDALGDGKLREVGLWLIHGSIVRRP